jgi:hypothetical protein
VKYSVAGTLVIFLILMPAIVVAQPGDGGGDPDVPISGIEILIALGSLFGLSRFFAKSKTPK